MNMGGDRNGKGGIIELCNIIENSTMKPTKNCLDGGGRVVKKE
jgi:hypothetical protein